MTFTLRIILLVFIIVNFNAAYAQKSGVSIDEVYGSDPLLFNGKYYTFYAPLNTTGTQYLTTREFEIGSATIRGVKYSGLLLNFDVYNQLVVLKYRFNTGAMNLIILSDAWLEGFSLSDKNFEVLTTPDSLIKVYQVIGMGEKRIFYSWYKSLELDSFYGSRNYIFSKNKREMYLFIENKIRKYSKNKNFCSLFGPEKETSVKEYLRINSINVKKAGDQTMAEVVNFCNTLSAR